MRTFGQSITNSRWYFMGRIGHKKPISEGQRSLTQSYPDLLIQETATGKFWEKWNLLFVKERNVTFDRYEAFTKKQGKTKTLEQFHCGLTEIWVKKFQMPQLPRWCTRNRNISGLFAANISNDEVQKDLLAETKTPVQAF